MTDSPNSIYNLLAIVAGPETPEQRDDAWRQIEEQFVALRRELQHAWNLLSVEGYADDPDWAGTRSIKDVLDATSNPAKGSE